MSILQYMCGPVWLEYFFQGGNQDNPKILPVKEATIFHYSYIYYSCSRGKWPLQPCVLPCYLQPVAQVLLLSPTCPQSVGRPGHQQASAGTLWAPQRPVAGWLMSRARSWLGTGMRWGAASYSRTPFGTQGLDTALPSTHIHNAQLKY